MPRASDLDTIAPDDPIASSPIPARPIPKTAKNKKATAKSASSSQSKNLAYRQKVYELIKNTTKTSLSSFLARPKVFTFETREDDEEIILVLRRHWFSNLGWILTALAMFIIPIFVPVLSIFSFFQDHFTGILYMFWYLITFAFAFEQFLSWYFNVFILTEERVVDVDFFNLLYKKVSEAKIDMIQDVTSSQIGTPQTIFNFGKVVIQTAGEINQIVLDNIPNPNLVLKVLQQMRNEEEVEKMEGRIK